MIVKEFRELVRDRRTLAMLIVMPLLLLIIFGYAANFYVSSVKAAVVGPQATQFAAQLPPYFEVTVTPVTIEERVFVGGDYEEGELIFEDDEMWDADGAGLAAPR